MWRWQQSGRSRLWTHIIASCALVHGIMLALLFMVYRGTVDNYSIYTSSALTTQHVILLPLHKVVGGAKNAPVLQAAKPVASAIDARSEVVERQTPVQEAKATTLASSSKKVKKEKKKREKKSKKAERDAKKKKLQEKSKKIKAKPETKKIETEKKIEDPKPVEKPVLASDTQVSMQVPVDAQSAIYVGQLEYEALQLQEAMQSELQTHWKPPIGHAGLTCVMRIIIDWQGTISDVIIEQSSDVLMFDMSAEQAIHLMTFPKTAWGKQVTITFS